MAETFVARVALPVPAADAFAWHERDGALERLSPPWERVRVLEKHGTIHDGDRVVLSVAGTLGMAIEHVHRDFVAGRSFRDEQVRGPFARLCHTHEVLPDGPRACVLEDRLEYALPLGGLGRALAGGMVRRRLTRMFAYRHETLRRDLIRHAEVRARPRVRVAIPGASGRLGRALAAFRSRGGHVVLRLGRRRPGPGELAWDPARGELDAAVLEGVDAVVHLAGETVGARWTPARKQRIVDSRVDGTRLIAQACAARARPPRVLVSASAIGIYGIAAPGIVDEASPPGEDFLAEVCRRWEAAAEPARAVTRVVNLRLGVVLTPAGGALAAMLPAFRAGVGGPAGSGRQVTSWVSLDDTLAAILRVLFDDTLAGPVNVVAPNPVTSAELAATLGRVLRRPAALRVPAAAIRLAFGELGELGVLGGVRVDPRRLRDAGFAFDDPTLEPWLRRVLGRPQLPG
jgi:uncharacterized protein (TIGR01777 family)